MERRRISTKGTTKARVFPEPVAASTATSLKEHRRGIVAAWTGVQKLKPASAKASRTGSEIGGFTSEKRVSVNALLLLFASITAAVCLRRRFWVFLRNQNDTELCSFDAFGVYLHIMDLFEISFSFSAS